MSEPVCTANASPVIRNEDRVGANGFHYHGANRQIVAPRRHRDPVAVFDAILFSQTRMNFRPRFRVLVYQRSDAPGLRSRQILADHSAGGQEQGIFFIDRIAAGTPLCHVEMRFAVVGIKLLVDE